MQFNTRLLHAESSVPMMHGEILPPVSQVSAFRYDTMESLEQVFHHKRMGYAYENHCWRRKEGSTGRIDRCRTD